ncbi:MAG: radical SAM protein [Candidatus Omnitrophota bacterium]
MNVILINPVRGIIPPFGLLYIAAVLERDKNHVEMVELATSGVVFDENHVFKNEKYLDQIVKKKPDLICMGFLSAYRFIAKETIEYLKEKLPGTPFVVGGIHPTHRYEETIKYGADFAVIGAGENTIGELVRNLEKDGKDFKRIKGLAYSDNGKIIFTGVRQDYPDLDKLPYPAYHLINYPAYLNTRIFAIRGHYLKAGYVFTGFGCLGECIFCCAPGKKMILRNISNIVDEVEWQKKQYNLEGMYILDDLFTISEKRVVDFCEEVLKRKLKLKFGCECRVRPFTEKMARIMKKAGFIQVEFGVESGSQKVLDDLCKNITVEDIERAFALSKRYKLSTYANMLIGSPSELREDIEATKRLLMKIKPDVTGFSFITPYPGTRLFDLALEKAWIRDENELNYQHGGNIPDLCINFSKEELLAIRDEFYRFTLQNIYPHMLRSPKFIFDMIKISLKTGFPFKYIGLMRKGKTSEAAQLFKNTIFNSVWNGPHLRGGNGSAHGKM